MKPESGNSKITAGELSAVFVENGWSYRSVPGREVIEAEFEADNGRVPLHVQAFPEIHAVAVVSMAGKKIATDVSARLDAVCELLCRVNIELTIGAFEMNPDEGQVLFRATNLFGAQGADRSILTGLVQAAVVEADRMVGILAQLALIPDADLGAVSVRAMLDRANADAQESSPS